MYRTVACPDEMSFCNTCGTLSTLSRDAPTIPHWCTSCQSQKSNFAKISLLGPLGIPPVPTVVGRRSTSTIERMFGPEAGSRLSNISVCSLNAYPIHTEAHNWAVLLMHLSEPQMLLATSRNQDQSPISQSAEEGARIGVERMER